MTTVEHRTFRDGHGVDISFRRWEPPVSSGVVVISHGASEHSGRYDRFARALNEAGFSGYALDHRGHGDTADATGIGLIGPSAGEALLEDLHQLVESARVEHPVLPVVLFGHSMGSMPALAYATRHRDLSGLVLSGFPAGAAVVAAFAEQLQQAIAAGMSSEPSPSLSGLNAAFEPARTPFDWLSRDAAEVDRYIADPRCGDDVPLTFGFLHELFSTVVPALEPTALTSIACPVLLITGERDAAADMGNNARQLEDALRAAGVTSASHYYQDARHELLNEINRDEITADVLAWVRAKTCS
ncbi:MAG: alpha/beta fold hydrolase [Mycobacteriales bacterium]